jgi:hypothetical protein
MPSSPKASRTAQRALSHSGFLFVYFMNSRQAHSVLSARYSFSSLIPFPSTRRTSYPHKQPENKSVCFPQQLAGNDGRFQ